MSSVGSSRTLSDDNTGPNGHMRIIISPTALPWTSTFNTYSYLHSKYMGLHLTSYLDRTGYTYQMTDTVTRSQLRPRSDLGLVNKLTSSTSHPPHTPSTPLQSMHSPCTQLALHTILLTLAIRSHTSIKGPCSPPPLFAEASHTHCEHLYRYASISFPTIHNASLRPLMFAIFPSTRPSSSYSGPQFSPSLKPTSLPPITFLT